MVETAEKTVAEIIEEKFCGMEAAPTVIHPVALAGAIFRVQLLISSGKVAEAQGALEVLYHILIGASA